MRAIVLSLLVVAVVMVTAGRWYEGERLSRAVTGIGKVARSAEPPPAIKGYSAAAQVGVLESRALSEVSGLAASRRNSEALWAINDSGHMPRLHALGPDGRDLGQVAVERADNVDWEDLASFTLDGRAHLLIADVGDNNGRRAAYTLYVVEEPPFLEGRVAARTAALAWRIDFTYPDGPADCEAVAVDAAKRSVLLLTKRGVPAVLYELPLEPTDEMLVARRIGEVRLPPPTLEDLQDDPVFGLFASQPTGLDVAADNSGAVVLTYGRAYYFPRSPVESWPDAFARTPAVVVFPRMRQAEALAFAGPDLYLTSEKPPAPLLRSVPRW